MPNILSAKYYLQNKRKFVKDIKIFLKKKKRKSNNMVVNVTKISQVTKINWLSIEKNIIQQEKMLCYNCKKVF